MHRDDIPPLLPLDRQPPITDPHALFTYWRALMGPLGFSRPLLWLCFISADDRPTTFLTQIDELPEFPDDEPLLTNLMYVARKILDEEVDGGSLAVLLSRPGTAGMTDSDRAWARGLNAACQTAGVPMRPVHLATDEAVRVFALDDLLGPDAA